MTEPVTSTRNPRIVAAAKLHDAKHRRRQGRTLLEGPGALAAAREAGAVIVEIFSLDDDAQTVVSEPVLARLAGTDTPRGPVAIVEIPPWDEPQSSDTLVLWEVSDPGNVGALIRSAAFMGYDVAVHGGADVWAPKTIRAAAGAQFSVTISSIGHLDDLPVATTLAAVAAGGVPPEPGIAHPAAIVVGNEAAGLPDAVVASATGAVTIPGAFESLNVAVAGSLLMDRIRLLR